MRKLWAVFFAIAVVGTLVVLVLGNPLNVTIDYIIGYVCGGFVMWSLKELRRWR